MWPSDADFGRLEKKLPGFNLSDPVMRILGDLRKNCQVLICVTWWRWFRETWDHLMNILFCRLLFFLCKEYLDHLVKFWCMYIRAPHTSRKCPKSSAPGRTVKIMTQGFQKCQDIEILTSGKQVTLASNPYVVTYVAKLGHPWIFQIFGHFVVISRVPLGLNSEIISQSWISRPNSHL